MSFVGVNRTCELSLFAHSLRKYHDLFKQEDCHLSELEVWTTVWIICTEKGTSQQQLPLSHNFPLKR